MLAHPVRLRIVHAMRGGRLLTTAQLCERLPDTSKATVYRHVEILTAGGILEVAEEERVRGAVQRRYRLHQDRATVDRETAQSLTPDDHRRVFTAAMATLLAEFNAYLDRPEADLTRDAVGYRQHAIWLSDDEVLELIEGMRAAILPKLSNEATTERTQYLLSPILFPLEDQPSAPPDGVTSPAS